MASLKAEKPIGGGTQPAAPVKKETAAKGSKQSPVKPQEPKKAGGAKKPAAAAAAKK
ncbi:hypothetical protein M569_01897 [Genlisea aurea]|uniref:Uncharacterized protein n=1 Tax=Genlisea aurea TaxID=192259 RepID=S8D656_9LAMI|nr:hypothetical protein M569_01897 [Genlisea aurea]